MNRSLKNIYLSFSLCILSVFGSLNLVAAPKVYIEPSDGFWSAHKMIVDGRNIGGQKLSEAFASNPEAAASARKSEYLGAWATGLLFAGLGAALIYSVDVVNNDNKSYNSSTYWNLFLAGFIPSIVISKYAQIHALRAINTYNGVYETKPDRSALFEQNHKPVGLVFEMNF